MTGATTEGTGTWRAVSASRRGSAHAEGVPNQDAVRVRRAPRPDGDVWVVGVADGHGGARYVRSDVGARTAVDVAVEGVSDALARGSDPRTVLRETVPGLVEAWRARVQVDAGDRPFTEDELARGPGGGTTAYGATLLVAVVGDHGVTLAQVGDGDALVRSHGFATRPVPGDERLVAGETTSLCLDTAVDDFRHAHVPASAEPDLVLLATDGYGNSFAQANWWHGLVDDVAALVVRSGFDRVADDLPAWLEESARVGGDDVSAVLLVRDTTTDDLVAAPPRTRELSAPPADPGPVPAPVARRSSRRAGVVAVVAAAAAVLAVVAAVLLLGRGPAAEQPLTPGDPASGTTTSTTSDPTTPTDGVPSTGGKGSKGGKEGKDGRTTTPPASESTGPGGPEQRPTDDGTGTSDQKAAEEPEKPLPGQG